MRCRVTKDRTGETGKKPTVRRTRSLFLPFISSSPTSSVYPRLISSHFLISFVSPSGLLRSE